MGEDCTREQGAVIEQSPRLTATDREPINRENNLMYETNEKNKRERNFIFRSTSDKYQYAEC
jgi:hypothetical protein